MRLLVADGSATIQRVIELAFSDKNVELVAVDSYLELLSEVKREKYDAVICDASLSGSKSVMDFVNVRKCNPEISFIFLKGNYDKVEEDSYREQGFVNFIQKPFDDSTLIEKVEQITSKVIQTDEYVPVFVDDDETVVSKLTMPKLNDLPEEHISSSIEDSLTSGAKGRKAFNMNEHGDYSQNNQTSPALDIDFGDPPDFKLETHELVVASSVVGNKQETAMDIDAVVAKMMPSVTRQIEMNVKAQVKQILADDITSTLREVVVEELRKLIDDKNSLG